MRKTLAFSLLLACSALPGCYYAYAVRSDHPQLRYEERRFFHGKGETYRFFSTLFRKDYGDEDSSPEIEIDHLERPFKGPEDTYHSEIRWFGRGKMTVDITSVRLEHRTLEGVLIVPAEREVEACEGNPRCIPSIRQTYRCPLPGKLIEHVYLELELEGQRHKVEVTLPLEYRYQYSELGALMSI
jgi:hypothetical protein